MFLIVPRKIRNKIFIGGIKLSMDENDLKSAFSKYGTVTDCKYGDIKLYHWYEIFYSRGKYLWHVGRKLG